MAKRAAAAAARGGGGASGGTSTTAAAAAAAAPSARGPQRPTTTTPPSSSSCPPSSPFLQRLRENLAVGTYIYFIPLAFLLNLAMVLLHRYTRWLWLLWLLAINFGSPSAAPQKTGRWPKPFRFWMALWRPLRSYFPAALHKTADLDPSRRYLFVAAPHGLVTMFVWVAFDTDATGFSRLFPGIDVVPLTLEVNFKLPLLREFLLLHGIGDASMAACLRLLGRGDGCGILLAAGGAEESLLAEPGTMDLVLAKRKGFVKVALRTGSLIVPVIGFGENELYGGKRGDQEEEQEEAAAERRPARPGRLRRAVSRFLKRAFGFVLPEIRGVGPLGLMPRRSPLDVVVGAPLALDERRAAAVAAARRVREREEVAVAVARRAAAVAAEKEKEKGGEEKKDKEDAGARVGAPSGAKEKEEEEKGRRKKGEAAAAAVKAGPEAGGQGGGPEGEGDEPPEPFEFEDMVEAYHAQYVEALKALYDAHKDRFLPNRKRDLEIVK